MPHQVNQEPLIAEIWSELEEAYDNRSERACMLAPEVGMTGPSLGRAIHEARDAHLSTFIRVARALGYSLKIELVPLAESSAQTDSINT